MPTFNQATHDTINEAHALGYTVYIIINGEIYDFCTNETEVKENDK